MGHRYIGEGQIERKNNQKVNRLTCSSHIGESYVTATSCKEHRRERKREEERKKEREKKKERE